MTDEQTTNENIQHIKAMLEYIPSWYLRTNDGQTPLTVSIGHRETSMAVYITFYPAGKLTATNGTYPRTTAGQEIKPANPKELYIEITQSANREPRAAARDLENRLLKRYMGNYNRMKARADQIDIAAKNAASIAAQLAEWMGSEPRQIATNPNKWNVYRSMSHGTMTAAVSSGETLSKIEIDIDNIDSIDMAHEIIRHARLTLDKLTIGREERPEPRQRYRR